MNVLDQWMQSNQELLTSFLTNIVIISEDSLKVANILTQDFIQPIEIAPPLGLIIAGNAMKMNILRALIFGKGVKSRITTLDQGKKPSRIAGFIEKVGRKPTAEDTLLITASYWFTLIPNYDKITGAPVIKSTMAVEYLPKK